MAEHSLCCSCSLLFTFFEIFGVRSGSRTLTERFGSICCVCMCFRELRGRSGCRNRAIFVKSQKTSLFFFCLTRAAKTYSDVSCCSGHRGTRLLFTKMHDLQIHGTDIFKDADATNGGGPRRTMDQDVVCFTLPAHSKKI